MERQGGIGATVTCTSDWDLILFLDECQFMAIGVEHFANACVIEWDRFGGGGPSLAWENILRYVNSMRRCIISCITQNGGHMRYQHIILNLQSVFKLHWPKACELLS